MLREEQYESKRERLLLHKPCSTAAPVASDSPLGQGMLKTTNSCEHQGRPARCFTDQSALSLLPGHPSE